MLGSIQRVGLPTTVAGFCPRSFQRRETPIDLTAVRRPIVVAVEFSGPVGGSPMAIRCLGSGQIFWLPLSRVVDPSHALHSARQGGSAGNGDPWEYKPLRRAPSSPD